MTQAHKPDCPYRACTCPVGKDSAQGLSSRTLRVELSEAMFREIRTAVFARVLSGSAAGLLDSFMIRFVELLDEGKTEWTVKRRTEKDSGSGPG